MGSNVVAGLTIRTEVTPPDRSAVRRIVESTGFFSAAECDVAVELVDERLNRGRASGYDFVFVETDGQLIGYTCFGLIACTVHSFDLYWIAVAQSVQGQGVGRRLLQLTEQSIRRQGGTRVYAETSGRPQYQPTRDFYERTGFHVAAVLADFYDHGDDKVIYLKMLPPES